MILYYSADYDPNAEQLLRRANVMLSYEYLSKKKAHVPRLERLEAERKENRNGNQKS